jgi:hypothetical protein
MNRFQENVIERLQVARTGLYNQLGMMKTAQKLFGLSRHFIVYRHKSNFAPYGSNQYALTQICKPIFRSAPSRELYVKFAFIIISLGQYSRG